jgi:hydrogenase-4 component B
LQAGFSEDSNEMNGIFAALAIWIAGAFAALAVGRRAAAWVSIGSLSLGIGALAPVVARALVGAMRVSSESGWQVPGAQFSLELDALGAWFLVPTLFLSLLAAVYGAGYLAKESSGRSAGVPWFFFNLLVASMVLVLLARNAVLFLTAWEVMALASFFLVTHHDEHDAVRRAGWIYLVATHIGTAFLVAFFLLLGHSTGSLDFGEWARAGAGAAAACPAGLLFALALIGFGAKAGIMPFHVWLPEAHPAAPSHVSAVMSGVMIKTGIYGLLRALTFLGEPQVWWGWLLIGLGIGSGILGVIQALAQQDLKRTLAYSSVENIGIITSGIGLGVVGMSTGIPWLAATGFGACLLHVLNHALFKGLLFMAAGSVLHAGGSGDMNRLGGVFKRMPVTGTAFLAGAAAISALPPLNGFFSEWMVLLGGLGAIARGTTQAVLAGIVVVAGLGLISGLAVACFTRAFGIAFLGEPRTPQAAGVVESGILMKAPMAILAASCVAVGLTAPWWVLRLPAAAGVVARARYGPFARTFPEMSANLARVELASAIFLTVVAALFLLRLLLLSGRQVTSAPTWDCGYLRPAASMQYTASSFARPITALFKATLGTRLRLDLADERLPKSGRLTTDTPDPCLLPLYGRLFRGVEFIVSRLRWMQHGNVHLYVLYIALTLVALWIWTMD